MPELNLTPEQHHLIQLINDYVSQFPQTELGDEQLLSTCYDYMDAFKRILESASKPQMDYICHQYDGFYRFARLMEKLAQGIANGVIDVPKDH